MLLHEHILWAVIAVGLIAAVAFMLLMKKEYSKDKIWILIVLMSMAAAASVGFFSYENIFGHDVNFHMLRIQGMADNLKNGVPFNKINFAFADGYGYLNSVFYPQLFLWIPAALVAAGLSLGYAYKVLIVMINIATVFISYICFKKISAEKSYALAATAVYALNCYRMTDIYVRAALGELLYIAFFPLVLYGIYAIFNGETKKWPILMIGASCIFQSHIIGTVLTAIAGILIIFGYSVVKLLKRQNIIKELSALIKAAVGTVLLNAWYIVPLLYYIRQDFKMFENTDSMERFSSFSQSLYNIFFKNDSFDSTSMLSHTGPVTGAVLILVTAVLLMKCIKNKKILQGTGYLVLALMFLGMTTVYFPWDIVATSEMLSKAVIKIQFTFRIMSLFISMLAMAFLLFLTTFKGDKAKYAAVICTCICLLSVDWYHHTDYQFIVAGYDGPYIEQGYTPEEYFMSIAKNRERHREDKLRTSDEKLVITDYKAEKAGARVTIDNNISADAYMDIPLYYYDGYVAFSESAQAYLPVQPGENGVIRVLIPVDVTGDITVQYDDRWFFNIAKAVSAASLVMLAVNEIRKKHTEKITV